MGRSFGLNEQLAIARDKDSTNVATLPIFLGNTFGSSADE